MSEELPPIEFGRIAAQTAKQVIVQKVREAERERQYEEYKDRVGEIVNGLVKRPEHGNWIIDLGKAEAMLRRDELLPREILRRGDRVRAYIYDVRAGTARARRSSSRARHPQFMAKLFAQEVPEIYDSIIEIKAVARDPGSRAKIAVLSQRQLDRSGRRLRRHARQPRSGGGQRTGGRKDRHHPVVARYRDLRRQRAGARRGDQGRHGRGRPPHGGRGPRRPAEPGDRPARPERPARLAAGRLGHRHPDRERRDRSGASRRCGCAASTSWRRSTSTTSSPACWSPRVSPRSTRSPMCRSRSSPGSRVWTRRSPQELQQPRARLRRGARPPDGRSAAASSASTTISPPSRA